MSECFGRMPTTGIWEKRKQEVMSMLFGLYEYVDQHCGYCEDDYFGTMYTKTPLKNRWLEREYHC